MKKPFLYALGASIYIVLVVLLIKTFTIYLKDKEDTIFIPMTTLSLFVLSAAIMGYIFLSEPVQMLLENKKQEAVIFFTKTVGFFACFLAIFVLLLFIV